jgi:MFS family permease
MAKVLNLQFAEKKLLDGASRGLQALLLPWTGAVVDRRGNVPVLALSWAIVAMAPAFLLVASPQAPWWIVGAYVCWIAYAGVNVTFPNLMLGLSAPGETPAYAAAWFAWTQLAYALAVLAGGWALDWATASAASGALAGLGVDRFAALFVAQWTLAVVGVLFARRIDEPPRNA